MSQNYDNNIDLYDENHGYEWIEFSIRLLTLLSSLLTQMLSYGIFIGIYFPLMEMLLH